MTNRNIIGLEYNNVEIIGETNRKHKDKSKIINCKCFCNIVFETSLKALKGGDRKSCGCLAKACHVGKIFNRIEIIDETHKRSGGKHIVTCKCFCGREFESIFEHIKSGKKKSCGCIKANIGETFNGIKILEELSIRGTKKSNSQLRTVLCKCHCGNIFTNFLTYVKRGKVTSCGCLWDFHGENNPNYNEKLTDDDRINNRYARVDFCKRVFARDNYICQICDSSNGKLNAHHMDGFHWCKDGRDKTENGVTLCIDCHNDFHNQYGRRFNTQLQFEKFRNLRRI